MPKAVLFDAPGCVGCRACEDACKKKYNLPPIDMSGTSTGTLPAETTTNNGTYAQPPELSASTWIKVRNTDIDDAQGFRVLFSLRKCMHCLNPACAAACPVGALQKQPDGPVVYDDNKCIGCRYCMVACPFGIPTYQWDKPVPFIRKCTFCPDLLAQGKDPACVEACHKRSKCVTLGERDEQIAKARKMIADSPGKYVNQIYGENEVGGTSWLFLSDVPFEKVGIRAFGTQPVPTDTEHAVVAVPPVLVGVAAVMSGFYWYHKRRDKISQENADKKSKGKVTK